MIIFILIMWSALIGSLTVFYIKRKSKLNKLNEAQKDILKSAIKKTQKVKIALVILSVILFLVFYIFFGETSCNNLFAAEPFEPTGAFSLTPSWRYNWDFQLSLFEIPVDIGFAIVISYCIYLIYIQKSKKITEEEKNILVNLNGGMAILGIMLAVGTWIYKTLIVVPMTITVDKPIIYLYPEKEEKVSVRVSKKEILTSTYPKYNDGWNVTAYPDGTLEDGNGRKYYALYWEGLYKVNIDKTKGFCVKGEDTIEFLEEKLSMLGLNEREAQEFIVYWLPQLEKNKYNYIYFKQTEEVNDVMGLDIIPTPDTVIRILMVFEPLNKEIEIEEQEIVTPERKGFTVVEWGGTKL